MGDLAPRRVQVLWARHRATGARESRGHVVSIPNRPIIPCPHVGDVVALWPLVDLARVVLPALQISWTPLGGATSAPRAVRPRECRLARVTEFAPWIAKPS